MSTSYLLDSSVLVLSLKQDKAMHHRLAGAEALYVSTVALGELFTELNTLSTLSEVLQRLISWHNQSQF